MRKLLNQLLRILPVSLTIKIRVGNRRPRR
jgi:hypothetical protein